MAGAVVGSRDRIADVRSAQIDTGATLGPFAAFLVLRGIATVAVRMERHVAHALALATLPRESRRACGRHLPRAAEPSRSAPSRSGSSTPAARCCRSTSRRSRGGRAFFDALTIPERTASLGSVHTMVVHPPTTSHRSLDAASLAAAGITEGLLRVSRRPRGRGRPDRRLRAGARGGERGRAPSAEPYRGHADAGRHRLEAAIATIAARRPAARPAPGIPARIASAVWGLLTSVDFAVLQISVLALLAVIGMTLRQLPGFAFRSPTTTRTRWTSSTRSTTRSLGHGRRRRARAAPAVPRLHARLVQHRAHRPDRLDRRLHARPDAAAVAPVRRHPGRPARPVLRPTPARPGAARRGLPPTTPPRSSGATGSSSGARPSTAPRYLYGDRNRWTKLATLFTHPA